MSHVTDPWPVDGHVHFRTLARVGPTLGAACSNFRAVYPEVRCGAVLLAQTADDTVFEQLLDRPRVGDWSIEPAAGETETLIARQGDVSLAIVCGRQVRAADGLEVLALGTRAVLADGLPFAHLVATALGSGAIVVLPWGFGKWRGERAWRVEDALREHGCEALFVGDNGTRMELLGPPQRIELLRGRGHRVLPGTDPFPIGKDFRRVGRLGFLAEVEFDAAAPWRRLRAWLMARKQSPVPYGRASGLLEFVVNQVGIQFHNRTRRGPAA
jgi:hypothetical protein